ncbi:hypothetical protein F5Y18DRAFT_5322 [Xylariaceae sp. FL1019]|nr:hypothetical protein F5Y18DRAFT_5322 [Xylariaceae sp. FL1019]
MKHLLMTQAIAGMSLVFPSQPVAGQANNDKKHVRLLGLLHTLHRRWVTSSAKHASTVHSIGVHVCLPLGHAGVVAHELIFSICRWESDTASEPMNQTYCSTRVDLCVAAAAGS